MKAFLEPLFGSQKSQSTFSPSRSLSIQKPADDNCEDLPEDTKKMLKYYLWDNIYEICDKSGSSMSWPEVEAVSLSTYLPSSEADLARLVDSNFIRCQLQALVAEGHILREAPEVTPEPSSTFADDQQQQQLKTPSRRRGKSPGRGGKKTPLADVPALVVARDEHKYRHNPDLTMDPPLNGSRSPSRNNSVSTPFRRLLAQFGVFGSAAVPEANEALDDTEKQTEQASTPGTLMYLISNGLKNEAIAKFRSNISLLHERGPVGELPVHYCFLLGGLHESNIELGFEMLKKDKNLISTQYCGQEHTSPYEGENILHIAIINKFKLKVITDLLQLKDGKKLLQQAATGTFFKDPYLKPKDAFGAHLTDGQEALYGQCYMGEYPLFFAIATNQFEIFEALVAAGANLNQLDSYGNNALHVLVILQNEKAYKYFKRRWTEVFFPEVKESREIDYCGEGKTNKQDPETGNALVVPWKQRNDRGLTPFTLAADRGLEKIFDWLVEEDRKLEWMYGKVTCLTYPLDNGLDNITSSELEGKQHHKSAIELIIRRGHLNFFKNTRIKDLFERKWNKFASNKVRFNFIVHCVYLTFLAYFSVLRQTMQTCGGAEQKDCSDSLTFYLSLMVVVLGAGKVGWTELRKVVHMGVSAYWEQPVVSRGKSIVSVLYFLLIACFCICHFFDFHDAWEQFFLGLSCPVGTSSLFFFLLAWKWTGPLVIMILEMLINDVFRFLSVYVVFLFGFSQAFFVLDNKKEGLSGLGAGALKLFETTLGDFKLNEANDSDGTIRPNDSVSTLLIVFFVVIVAVLMLNLLVAMMGATYQKVADEAEMRWQMERARIISTIENEMSVKERELKENVYYLKVRDRRFLQVYDKNEKHFDIDDPAPGAAAAQVE